MDIRTIEQDGVKIVVGAANTLMGMRRTRIREEGRKEIEQESDVDRRILRIYTYPDLIAATVEAEGIPWPLDFEPFLELPDHLVAEWEQAIYELNPHWIPKAADQSTEDAEKKAS